MTKTNITYMLHGGLTAFHTGQHGLSHGRPEECRPAESSGPVEGIGAEGTGLPLGRRVEWVDPGPPDGPWAVRVLSGGGRRAAMEIHELGELRDVVVESALTVGLLRGARRVDRRRRWPFSHLHGTSGPGDGCSALGDRPSGRSDSVPAPTTIAWGRLPESGMPPLVTFLNGVRGGRRCAGQVVPVAERFWIAYAEGAFTTVRAETAGGDWAEVRARRTPAVGRSTTDDTRSAATGTGGAS
ncbi:hypothetical protein [Kitasatospora terrestris]